MRFKSLLSIAAVFYAASASAQVSDTYLGGEYASITFKDNTSIASTLVSAVGGSAASVQDTGMGAARFFGGMRINDNFGAEIGYFQSAQANANFSGISRTSVAYTGTAKQQGYGFDFSALLRPSKESGLNGLFFRIGGHSTTVQYDLTLISGLGSGASSTSKNGTGTLVGFGYDGKLNNKLGFRVGYTNYSTIGGVSGNDVSALTLGILASF